MGHAWSAYQQAIFHDTARGTGHTEIMARAGSGKTTTIVEALGHIPRGERALLCAFNRSIRDELLQRAPMGVHVKTLNGLGFQALRSHFGDVTVNEDKLHRIVEGLTLAAMVSASSLGE